MNTKGFVCMLALAGFAQPVAAQVSRVFLQFQTQVPDLRDANTGDSLGNESFVEMGTLDLLPYARTAEGGDAFNMATADVSLSGHVSPSGRFTGSGSNSADESFTVKPNTFGVWSRTTIDITVSSPAFIELSASGFFDNDGGSSSLSLVGPLGVVFTAGGQMFFEQEYSGVLMPGEYVLHTFVGSRGDIDYSFSIVPAPSGMALIGVAGLGLVRRRR